MLCLPGDSHERTRQLMKAKIAAREYHLKHYNKDIDEYVLLSVDGQTLEDLVTSAAPKTDRDRRHLAKHARFRNGLSDLKLRERILETLRGRICTSELGQLGGLTLQQVADVMKEEPETLIDLHNPSHRELSTIFQLTAEVKAIITGQLADWIAVNDEMPAHNSRENLDAPVSAFFACFFEDLVQASEYPQEFLSMFDRWKILVLQQ